MGSSCVCLNIFDWLSFMCAVGNFITLLYFYYFFSDVTVMKRSISLFLSSHNASLLLIIAISGCKTKYKTGNTLRRDLRFLFFFMNIFCIIIGATYYFYHSMIWLFSLLSYILFAFSLSNLIGEYTFKIDNESIDEPKSYYTHLIYPKMQPEVAPQL